jgi:hypothetical protein
MTGHSYDGSQLLRKWRLRLRLIGDRKGGPLTVTDANLFLGRLHIDSFPKSEFS